MLNKLFANMFGSRNSRVLKQCGAIVKRINLLEEEIKQLSDQQLKQKTSEFKQRIIGGETLENLLPEAFATVREVAVRQLGMRHFDVQLIGGMVLNDAKIAEMRTGEGKTLVSTLAVYLNALVGRGVHVITVNDYLAKRDADWMRPVYDFLGMTVGVIYSGQSNDDKRAAYACDITYGTNNEFGFDYLRDNMAFSIQEKVQRDLYFAVIDEVDSILIDEARTPLIISGASEDSSQLYIAINRLVPKLTQQSSEQEVGDYELDEKSKQVHLTETGHEHLEELLTTAGLLSNSKSLYDVSNINLMHHINAALRAHTLFQKDVDYIVQNGEIVIVDEHTGRTMPGRRWSDGLHQAIEAKENVRIQNENVTLASITFQNYFRLYEKLSGMTGTADTEAYELQQIYGLEVVVIPTNKPMLRTDHPDHIYINTKAKYDAVVKDVQQSVEKGQPVLVGTVSIEASEALSNILKKNGIKHNVLNAKFHEKEAEIIAQAGRPGSVTIATNMAGRGTDIVLGGNLKAEIAALNNPTEQQIEAINQDWQKRHQQVIAAGGLHIIGSERHESRRIDNQLRGRSGRQGDPGSSRFYLSLEDNLMRLFASERLAKAMRTFGMTEDEAIEHSLVTKTVETAQRKVEGYNFDIRKQLLEYDDVANDQRKVIYAQRAELMASDDISETIEKIINSVINNIFETYIPPESLEEQWNVAELEKVLHDMFGISCPLQQWLEQDEQLDAEQLKQRITEQVQQAYKEKEANVGAENLRYFEKILMMQSLDNQWREHLSQMDQLRQSVGWRGYAQKNPKQEYKREAFDMFNNMLEEIKQEVATNVLRVEIAAPEELSQLEQQQRDAVSENLNFQHSHIDSMQAETDTAQPEQPQSFVRTERKVGRNEPCVCGSGKKYKHCCGRIIH
jgi:preprotein translocase subunit SecA